MIKIILGIWVFIRLLVEVHQYFDDEALQLIIVGMKYYEKLQLLLSGIKYMVLISTGQCITNTLVMLTLLRHLKHRGIWNQIDLMLVI